jgi:hypothetical protein
VFFVKYTTGNHRLFLYEFVAVNIGLTSYCERLRTYHAYILLTCLKSVITVIVKTTSFVSHNYQNYILFYCEILS